MNFLFSGLARGASFIPQACPPASAPGRLSRPPRHWTSTRPKCVLHKFVLQKLGGRRPFARVAAKADREEVTAGIRNVFRNARGLLRRGNGVHRLHRVVEGLSAPGLASSKHLDDNAREAPDVGQAAIPATLQDLGCHPQDRAVSRERLCIHVALRATEIGQLCAKVQVDEHIGTLQVPVNHGRAVRVEVAQAFKYATRGFAEKFSLQRAEFFQHGPERTPGNIFKVDEQGVVLALVFVSQVTDDVPMSKILADLELALQGLEVFPVFAVSYLCDLHREYLARRRVLCLVHAAEGPSSYLPSLPPVVDPNRFRRRGHAPRRGRRRTSRRRRRR
mmetsp:Transcript_49961/g.139968  ORF Transcript_49961/g.139968 Transcript_49961/m.139968 type:complete len:333 (+) Transcript_49961:120-1118(+)